MVADFFFHKMTQIWASTCSPDHANAKRTNRPKAIDIRCLTIKTTVYQAIPVYEAEKGMPWIIKIFSHILQQQYAEMHIKNLARHSSLTSKVAQYSFTILQHSALPLSGIWHKLTWKTVWKFGISRQWRGLLLRGSGGGGFKLDLTQPLNLVFNRHA